MPTTVLARLVAARNVIFAMVSSDFGERRSALPRGSAHSACLVWDSPSREGSSQMSSVKTHLIQRKANRQWNR